MASHIERLFVNSHTERQSGWIKTTTSDNKMYRNIKIGNIINCNDEIIRDNTTMLKIESSLAIYNVTPSRLEQVENKYEHYVTLCLIEEEYMKLINGIMNK
jgi:hypothetical protein